MPHVWEGNDATYTKVKDRILKFVMAVGIAATFVGGTYNFLCGYQGMPVIVHLAGFILLCLMLIFYNKISKKVLLITVFSYFCFVYTPFAWVTLMGLYSSVTYVIYIFFLLISILMDEKMSNIFTAAYFIEIIILVIENYLVRPVDNPPTPFFPLAFSYIIMLCVLILVMGTYKKQFSRFLHRNRRDSITDPLTGLNNRRAFDDYMKRIWDAGKRNGNVITVMMIDIDHFKSYNDNYGHQKGDECLIAIVDCIKPFFQRSIDMAARYGGEEFIVLCPFVKHEDALRIAEQVRGCVEQLDAKNDFIPLGRVTISIGVASSIPRQEDKYEHIIKLADDALYDAKNSGRNKVCFKNE